MGKIFGLTISHIKKILFFILVAIFSTSLHAEIKTYNSYKYSYAPNKNENNLTFVYVLFVNSETDIGHEFVFEYNNILKKKQIEKVWKYIQSHTTNDGYWTQCTFPYDSSISKYENGYTKYIIFYDGKNYITP